jgi:hypothetical protein
MGSAKGESPEEEVPPMATLEAIQPYVEHLFDDADVRRQLARAAANLRGAQARAGKAKSKKKALMDPALRHRLAEGARAAFAVAVALKEGPEKDRRRNRRARLLVLGLLAAGGFVAANAQARAKVMELVGGGPSPEGEA